ncbi:methyltransferase [Zavarzinella formosa]|uniref:methyltransferase n=1 Tax=Zavarzinella formosa TaxID=360055 RepID=UPI00031E3AB3|nr:methyltransferase [Zavarzinella formosa]
MWDAKEYLKFADERSRPFADLLGQVRQQECRRIVDLGCGTGHLTLTLAERWPAARVTGVDQSAEMLAKATPLAIPHRLEFVQADIADWSADGPVDLLVSNAALHWLGDHRGLFTRLAGLLAPGGTLAVQMPNRFRTATQFAVEEATADPRWASRLQGVGLHRESVMPLTWYVDLLHDLGFAVNAWETTYVHVLTGENPVVEWLKGTGLRPLLERLEAEEQADFLRILSERLKADYPARGNTTLLPMPRVFFVATRYS